MNIKKAREKAGLTQQELADKLGVGQSAVAMWESQKALPRTDKLPVLAKVLKCSVSALLKNQASHTGRQKGRKTKLKSR